MPFSETLPLELIFGIVDVCSDDIPTLRALAITSKSLQLLAEKHIWRDTDFTRAETVNELIERLQCCILAHPKRASFIRAFRVDISYRGLTRYGDSPSESASRLRSLSDPLRSALALMRSLECLEIITRQRRASPSLLASISEGAEHLPFRLRTFSTDARFPAKLYRLIRAQPTLESVRFIEPISSSGWRLLDPSARFHAPHLLPKLTTLSCEATDLRNLATGRPIHTLVTKLANARDISDVVEALERTSRPVKHLHLTCFYSHMLPEVLLAVGKMTWRGLTLEDDQSLATGCTVESLVLTSVSNRDTPPTMWGDYHYDLLRPLCAPEHYPHLQKLHLRGNLRALVRFDPKPYASPKLTEVGGASEKEVAGGGMAVDKYVRQVRRDDGKWKLEDDFQDVEYPTDPELLLS